MKKTNLKSVHDAITINLKVIRGRIISTNRQVKVPCFSRITCSTKNNGRLFHTLPANNVCFIETNCREIVIFSQKRAVNIRSIVTNTLRESDDFSSEQYTKNPTDEIDPDDIDIEFDDDDEEEQSGVPWKSLLEITGKASWRVTELDTISVASEAARNVLDSTTIGRTSNKGHLRKIHERVMEQQKALAKRRDQERIRIILNRPSKEDEDKRKTNRGGGIGGEGGGNTATTQLQQPIPYGLDEAYQHIQYRLVPQYSIIKRILQETKSLLMTSVPSDRDKSSSSTDSESFSTSNWSPVRMIDYGIGCGSASAAAIDVFGGKDDSGGLEWIHGIDPSQTMREVSLQFLQEYIKIKNRKQEAEPNATGDSRRSKSNAAADQNSKKSSIKTRVTVATHLSSSLSSNGSDVDDATSTESARASSLFDLAIMAYTASEFPNNSATLAAVGLLWQKLRDGGVLVVVEPGTPDGFTSIRMVRHMLLHCINGLGSNDDDDDDDDFHFNPADYTTDDGENDDDNDIDDDENMTRNEAEVSPNEMGPQVSTERFVEECHVIAPCTHNGQCPMDHYSKMKEKFSAGKKKKDLKKENTKAVVVDDSGNVMDGSNESTDTGETTQGFCSFVQTMPGGSTVGYKGEKFSYIVVQKRIIDRHAINEAETQQLDDAMEAVTYEQEHGNANVPFEKLHVTDLLERSTQLYDGKQYYPDRQSLEAEVTEFENRFLSSQDDDLGLELLRGDTNRQSFGRIIHAPKKRRGHVLINACAFPGKIVRYAVSKSAASDLPGIYSAARKSRWGGLWPNVHIKK